MKILGIETSCDETGLAIYDSKTHKVYHEVHSQVLMHDKYGGVVPELASRDHIKRLVPLLKSVLQKSQLTLANIDGIAYTAGPGLIGALLTGASFARSLAWSLNVPAIGVHHMEGHLLAPLLENTSPSFPFIALLVSGGHTQLMHVESIGKYKLLGDTLDDAAGEAFDKVAKLLGLGYPGGARLSKLAEKGNAKRFHFSRPMVDRPGLDFSFSGLKTQVLNAYEEQEILTKNNEALEILKADIAASFQQAVIDTLHMKCKRALNETNLKQLVVGGGVSANSLLKETLKKLNAEVYFPRLEFSGDNGAMIAYAGYHKLKSQTQGEDLKIKAQPRWEL